MKYLKTKKELRKEYLNIRDSIAIKDITNNSNLITNKILSLEAYKEANIITTYVNFGSEVITKTFINHALKDNKKIYVPLTDKQNKRLIFYQIKDLGNDLEKGIYGILEPKSSLHKISQGIYPDIVLVPGLTFSVSGSRIGYGGGYYDRYLKTLGDTSKRIGIAFDFQVQKNIPTFDYDEKVDMIITEKKTIQCINNE